MEEVSDFSGTVLGDGRLKVRDSRWPTAVLVGPSLYATEKMSNSSEAIPRYVYDRWRRFCDASAVNPLSGPVQKWTVL